MKKLSNNSRAFSMIELSVVILIIGILVSGILASNAIIKKFRIQTAQTLTISSPVQGISDSVLWLESSLDKSFKSSESSDTSTLSAWYDVRESVNKNNATQSNSGNYPTYSNSINSIQAVKFDGTNGYFTVDGSILNNTNYTIFVLEQRESNKSGNYFIGDSSSANEATTNKNLVLGYSADSTIKHSQSSDNSYTSSISSYAASYGKSRVFTFVHDKSSGKKTYINGLLAATSTDKNHLSGMTALTIGKSYQGQLGEIIMFARALKTEEIQAVEEYLGKKWNIAIDRVTNPSGSGSSGGGSGGSSNLCNVPATIGITTTSVTSSSGTLTCDASQHFKTTPTLAYTCSGSTFSYTAGSSCTCEDNYILSGSSCIANTSICSGGAESTQTISGISYKIHTFTTTATLTCTTAVSNAQVLVVAGGGGGSGGAYNAGGVGGGAGGVVYNSSYSLAAGSTTATVGLGGDGSASSGNTFPNLNGNNGQNSSFGTITATGGGGGGARTASTTPAPSGGSGGGGGISGISISGGAGVSGQGFAGGNNYAGAPNYGGGGGGGAGAAGQDGTSTKGGNGGIGVSNSITGTPTYYGGGGGSSYYSSGGTNGTGGLGGGGNVGSAGTNGYGGGGGGSSAQNNPGLKGGSGVVIVRYAN